MQQGRRCCRCAQVVSGRQQAQACSSRSQGVRSSSWTGQEKGFTFTKQKATQTKGKPGSGRANGGLAAAASWCSGAPLQRFSSCAAAGCAAGGGVAASNVGCARGLAAAACQDAEQPLVGLGGRGGGGEGATQGRGWW